MTRDTTFNRLILFLPALLGVAGVAACDNEIEDGSFQSWCGDTLCNWDVEEGSIARVGTWHPADYGVELTSTPTVLSQVVDRPTSAAFEFDDPDLTPADVEEFCDGIDGLYFPETNECVQYIIRTNSRCVRFELTADVEPSAQVVIEVDYGADGSVDFTQPVVASEWEPVSHLVAVPYWPGTTRYRIHKRGEGRARIANFGVHPDDGCVDVVEVDERPLGVGCEVDAECASGICADVGAWRACSECATDAVCDPSASCVPTFDGDSPHGAYRACQVAP